MPSVCPRKTMAAAAAMLAVMAAAHFTRPAAAVTQQRVQPVSGKLRATAKDPTASGRFDERASRGRGRLRAALAVSGHGLAPRATYGVNIGGRQIGALRTNSLGSGMALFRTTTGGRASRRVQALAVDPRGQVISVTDPDGDEVLEGEVDDPSTPGGIRCCLNIQDTDGDQDGCDSLLPEACASAGGTDLGPGSCEPDPCPNTGPDDEGSDGETNDGPDGESGD